MFLIIWICLAVAALLWFIFVFNKYQNDYQNYQGKLFNFLFVVFFVFIFLTVGFVYIKSGITLTTLDNILLFAKTYFFWIGHVFGSLFKVTGYAVEQNWGVNLTNSVNSSAP